MNDRKYAKCHECDFMETRVYPPELNYGKEWIISLCNKYNCSTGPERNCLNHKTHRHSNYEPELVKK